MEKREKIVLIDGHSILTRAFFGVPDLTNAKGIHTNAVYGFLNIMLKILEEEKPEYLMVAFDRKEPTFRHKMYDAYKGTRKPMPQELHQQVPIIQDVLKAMGIPVITKAGYEADDILGTIATKAQENNMDVSLISGDRDLLQLASERILIRIPKTKRGGTQIEDYHAKDVVDTYGITPKQVIDMKGLMGDFADNIPGVPGVGEKTALKILSAFPTLEDAYENIDQVEPKRVRELLGKHRDLAFLSKELATIKTDCDITFSFQEAYNDNIFTQEAFAWIKKLELKSLEKRFDPSVVSKATHVDISMKVLVKKEQAKEFVDNLCKEKPQVVGIGFLGDEWVNAGAVEKKTRKKATGQMQLVFDEESMDLSVDYAGDSAPEYPFYGMSIAYIAKEPEIGVLFVGEEVTGDFLLECYEKIQEHTEKILVMNWKNILHLTTPVEKNKKEESTQAKGFFERDARDLKKLFQQIVDVSLAAYLLNPLKDSYTVDQMAGEYTSLTVASYEETFGKDRLEQLFATEEYEKVLENPLGENELTEKIVQYLGNQAYIPLECYDAIKEQLQEKDMEKLLEEIEIPTSYYLYEMEHVGVHVDRQELEAISKLLEEKILALETDIYDLAGEEFNINSPKQLGVILFEKMKLPFAKKTKTGYSTSADILEKLKKEDPIIGKILEYRQVSKLKSTYADGLPVFISTDERIHGKFNQTITATGRISSTDPNLQNIPIRMELGREIRKVFKPQKGCVFLDADYSQIELRVLAHMSGDQELIQAYLEEQDIHRSTASKVFHTPYEEVTDLQRRNAKAVNFGIVYGISAFGLSQDLNITKKEAQEYIDQYFATYPAVKEFVDSLVEQGKEKGYATTLFGRKRPVPELASGNFMQRSFGERIAMNSPIQGTAADIIKIAMIRVASRLQEEKLQAKIVLQVHDELLVETPVEEKDKVKRILEEEMPKAVSLQVPLEVEVVEGNDWNEAH